jgi:hypothetical protein
MDQGELLMSKGNGWAIPASAAAAHPRQACTAGARAGSVTEHIVASI